MTEQTNVILHKKAHEAFTTGNMDMMIALMPEDTVWHSLGQSPIVGDFQGRDTVFQKFFGKMDELSASTAKFVEHQDYIASENHSVALFRWAATRNGQTLVFNVCEVIRWSNGQIAEEWSYYDDQYGWDEFWS